MYPVGARLIDTSGTGYAARVGVGFNDILTVEGKRVGDLGLHDGVRISSRRHGRVLHLVLDMGDATTRELLGGSEGDVPYGDLAQKVVDSHQYSDGDPSVDCA